MDMDNIINEIINIEEEEEQDNKTLTRWVREVVKDLGNLELDLKELKYIIYILIKLFLKIKIDFKIYELNYKEDLEEFVNEYDE